ncbi:mechanosensitive ion channel family protein [Anditalea andensis]|uniref:Mechanosensitive ion channel protein MscS n=1 Tax=Anditalea andensis TaxID=1048983 RepID=A0A074KSI2_9BACT|nr:mechanosensitive ion channel domain-containing protein [Anditalea andensis]KEO72921.1 mechanosensitive ion channel protein MscS [Anditalea andensis]
MEIFTEQYLTDRLILIGSLIGTLIISHAVIGLLFRPALKIFFRPKTDKGTNSVLKLRNSLSWGLFFVLWPIAEPLFAPDRWEQIRNYPLFSIFMIVSISWILIELSNVLRHSFIENFSFEKDDNLRERRMFTQINFVRKLVVVLIVIVALSFILMSIESARRIGAGLLTSAGIAGIIVGFAAQKSIANLLAGFQIAFTQPIRIDDVVVLEGEWGKIEEINLTYVVVRIWDQRRLILPINYFLETPFQNWTRTTANIWGTVFLYVDHTVPVKVMKNKLKEILDSTPLWDKKVQVLQVTDVKERTVELRCLMSARDSPSAFDLRCYVREEMLDFIQREYPETLPKTRVLMERGQADIEDVLK